MIDITAEVIEPTEYSLGMLSGMDSCRENSSKVSTISSSKIENVRLNLMSSGPNVSMDPDSKSKSGPKTHRTFKLR